MSIGATSRSSTAGLAVGRAEWLTYRYPCGRVVRFPNGRIAGVVVIESDDLLHARLAEAAPDEIGRAHV